ncbi:hypothetical protein HDE_10327 [Halotydeus destructor]|nr:hypothetical protein HDE_10327 [Halotydeus destructor]
MRVVCILLLVAVTPLIQSRTRKTAYEGEQQRNFTHGANGEKCAGWGKEDVFRKQCMPGLDTCCWKSIKYVCSKLPPERADRLRRFEKIEGEYLCLRHVKIDNVTTWHPPDE